MLVIPIAVLAGIVGVSERIHNAVFDRRSNAVLTEFFAESFRVVAMSSSEAPQVIQK